MSHTVLKRTKELKRPKPDYRLHVHSTRALIDQLNQVCKLEGISRAHLVENLIIEFLNWYRRTHVRGEDPKVDEDTIGHRERGEI